MADDDLQQQDEVVIVENEAEEEAGFNSVAEPPADNAEGNGQAEVDTGEDASDTEQQQEQAQGDQQAKQSQAQETPEQEIDRLRAELQAKLDAFPEHQKATQENISKIHGKFGEMNRTMQQLQQQVASMNSGSGAKFKINPEKLTRLTELLDPEVAKALAEDLSEAMEVGESGGGANHEEVQALVSDAVNKATSTMNQTMQVNLLNVMHKDWRDIHASQEFADYKATLKPEDQAEIDKSWDAQYLGDVFTNFKAWRSEKNNTQQRNSMRLANAIVPASKGSAVKGAVTEEDGFNLVASGR